MSETAAAFERLHPALRYHIVNSLGWSGLRPAQAEAVAPVVEGRDCLLLAPTAGGKTEAAAFPLLSRMLTEDWRGLSVLYVCPIRALLNNLEPRLAHYAGLVGRRVGLWHGDVPAGAKKAALRDPPDLLLTTPESVEALLISVRADHRAFFAGLQAVVVDELHAFASDDRGWHLRALLGRLEAVIGRPVQRIGLSATVGNPQALGHWLAAGRPCTVAGRTGGGETDITLDHVGSVDNAATVISRLHRGEKRLVFCDSRARVEQVASGLRSRGVRTFVSHSSLSADERRQAEAAFAAGRDCVIVATSTMELGIDVGDLDRVIQVDAPPSVSSLLQRMGRTGRRAGSVRNCLVLTTTEKSFLQSVGLLKLFGDGYVEDAEPPPLPLHIVGQQTVALLLQRGGLEAGTLATVVAASMPEIAAADVHAIIHHMRATGLLFQDGALLGIGPEGERLFGRRHFMDLMSAFTTPMTVTVHHGGMDLGEVDPIALQAREDGPAVILLAGRAWRIVGIDWTRRRAYAEPAAAEGRSRWFGVGRSLPFPLARAMHAVLTGDAVPVTLSRRATERLAVAREDHGWLAREGTTLVTTGETTRWWTFAGGGANAVLAQVLREAGVGVTAQDDTSLSLRRTGAGPALRDLAVGSEVLDHLPIDDRLLDAIKFRACLPDATARRIAAARLVDIDGAEFVASMPSTWLSNC